MILSRSKQAQPVIGFEQQPSMTSQEMDQLSLVVADKLDDVMVMYQSDYLITEAETTFFNITTTSTPPPMTGDYQITWTGEVLFRVITLVTVMILTIVGNTLLLFIIISDKKQRKKRVNIFLINLAIGDLMVCVFTMSTEVLFVAFGEWVLGAVACKLIVYGQIVTLASATFLLTGMSIDRFQVIVRPLQAFTAHPSIWKKVVTAWILAFIFAIPQLFIFVQTDEGIKQNGEHRHFCRSKGYSAEWQRKTYFLYLTTYILLIPTCVMSFCYINIMRVVWKRMDSGEQTKKRSCISTLFNRICITLGCRDERGVVHVEHNKRVTRRRFAVFSGGSDEDGAADHHHLVIPRRLVSSSKRNVVKMTFTVILAFVICWTPYFVVGLSRIFTDYKLNLRIPLAVAEIMALVHSALNPILYCVFFAKLSRRSITKLFGACGFGTTISSTSQSRDINSELETSYIFANDGVISDKGTVTIGVTKPSTSSQSSSSGNGTPSSLTISSCLTCPKLFDVFRRPTRKSSTGYSRNGTLKINGDKRTARLAISKWRSKYCSTSKSSNCMNCQGHEQEFRLTVRPSVRQAGSNSNLSISPPDTPDYRRGSFSLIMESLKTESCHRQEDAV